MEINSRHRCLANWLEDKNVVESQYFGDPKKDKKWVRGITKCIPQLSPEFSISVCLQGVENKVIKPKKQGRKRGNELDKELTLWTKEKKKYREPSEAFLKVKQMMDEKGLTPIQTQLPLACKHLNIGTRLDVLCEDRNDNYVILEIKRGYDDYFDVHNQGNFIVPAEELPVSFRMKSFLQLLVTCWLFHHTVHELPDKTLNAAYVVHVFENEKEETQIDAIPLPFWMYANTTFRYNILKSFFETSHQNQAKRKQEKKNGAARARRKYRKQEENKKS